MVGNWPFSVENIIMTVHFVLFADKKASQFLERNEY